MSTGSTRKRAWSGFSRFLSADKKKTYCLYEAPNPEAIRAAARRAGVPADVITEVGGEIGPTMFN